MNGHLPAEELENTIPLGSVNPQEDENLDETPEQLVAAHLKLSNLRRDDGQVLSMTKQQLSLYQQMLHSPDKTDLFIQIVLTCDFESEEERRRVVNAFYEADRLGMNTNWNVADALSRSATNRKHGLSSRVRLLIEGLTHTTHTTNAPRSKDGSANPRSPLS